MDNYMMAIINGPDDIDGNIDYIMGDESTTHVDLMIDYGASKYPNSIFDRLPSNCEIYTYAFFLTVKNNIVYLHILDKRRGRRGMLFLPDQISDKQIETLYKLASMLEGIDVDIIYDLDFDDGIANFRGFEGNRWIDLKDKLDDFFQTVNIDRLGDRSEKR